MACKVILQRTTVIVSLAERSNSKLQNNFRPEALTSTDLRCFECRPLTSLINQTQQQLDLLQFAHRHSTGMVDAVITLLLIFKMQVPLHDSDFWSAFKTVHPNDKAEKNGVNHSQIRWVNDVLVRLTFLLQLCLIHADVCFCFLGLMDGMWRTR